MLKEKERQATLRLLGKKRLGLFCTRPFRSRVERGHRDKKTQPSMSLVEGALNLETKILLKTKADIFCFEWKSALNHLESSIGTKLWLAFNLVTSFFSQHGGLCSWWLSLAPSTALRQELSFTREKNNHLVVNLCLSS